MPIHNRLLAASAASALTFLAAGLAHASNDTGLEVMLRPAIGSAGGSSPIVFNPAPGVRTNFTPDSIYAGKSSPYGVGFIGEAAVGYRFIPFLSAGLSAGIRNASGTADDATDVSRAAFMVGPYVRGYVPSRLLLGLEPWLSIGVEYMRDAQSYGHVLNGVPAKFTLVHYGVAVPIGVGVDYRFAEFFAVGPSFQYARAFSQEGCAKAEAPGFVGSNFCASETPRVTESQSYGVWSVGLDLRVTLF